MPLLEAIEKNSKLIKMVNLIVAELFKILGVQILFLPAVSVRYCVER